MAEVSTPDSSPCMIDLKIVEADSAEAKSLSYEKKYEATDHRPVLSDMEILSSSWSIRFVNSSMCLL